MDDSPKTQNESDPDLPRYSEWKSWYRFRVMDWLMVHRDYQYEGIDKCLQQVGEKPSCREAAVALFWGVYLRDEEPLQLTEAQVGQIQAILYREIGKVDKVQEQHTAFVKLLLAGTLSVSLIRPEAEAIENPIAVKALETAAAMGTMLDTIEGEYEEDWGRKQLDRDVFVLSLVVAAGITDLELALCRAQNGRFEEALYLMSDATTELDLTMFHSFDPHPERERARKEKRFGWRLLWTSGNKRFEYLPHSRQALDPQDAVDIFEKLRVHPEQAKDWGKVRNTCRHFVEQYSDWGSVKTGERRELEGSIYWEKAETFAENRLSPDQFRKMRDEDEREGAEQRLCRDFFDDVWSNLPPGVRDSLIDAERHWSSRPKPQYDHMTSAYREALEGLLKIHLPFLAKMARRRLEPNIMQWLPPLPTDRIPRNFLGKASISLEYDPTVIAWVKSLVRKDEDRRFLRKRFPNCLRELVEVRNYYEHRDTYESRKKEKDIVAQAKKIRCEILGIGSGESIVRHLWRLGES